MTLAITTGSKADTIAAAGWTLLIEYPKETKSWVWGYTVHYRFAHAATGRIYIYTTSEAQPNKDGSFDNPVDLEYALRAMMTFLVNHL
jgi:hypothetical protein